MRYGSICSGIEAASVAWEPLGWRPSFFSEIDAFPRAVLTHHYPEVPLHGDFTTINAGEYAPIDLLVGGTPCQSFSVAGLRGGLDDDRGNLALEFCRLAERLGPRWVVWENVPGVLSLDGGRAFASILGGLAQCGYGLAYRVLDAEYVRVDGFARAVPQRRQRVFVVGYLGDWRRAAAVLFEPEGLRRDPPPRREEGKVAAYTLDASAGRRCGLGMSPNQLTVSIAGALGAGSPGGGWRISGDEEASGQLVAYGGGRTGGPVDVAATLTAKGMRIDFEVETFVTHDGSPPLTTRPYADHESREGLLVAHTLRADGFDASEDGTGRGVPLVPVADTLTAHWHHSQGQKAGNNVGLMNPISHSRGVRRLTPIECERLQGYPDNYTLVPWRKKLAADGPRYKAIGNSMAINVMRWIGMRIAMMEAAE